jgi:N-acetylglucosaminyl-diphospho-decaprenol L-rhamnosyltransferase
VSLTVVTVLHRSAPELAALLASLERHLPGRQLVVVDTGPDDGGAELARRHGAEVVALPENPGFGPANNAGVALARHEVTALLNPDIVLPDDGLRHLADAARRHDALHVPALRNPDGSPQRSAHPVPGGALELLPGLLPGAALPGRLRRRAEPWRPDGGGPRAVGWAIAAALVARTATLRALGPFDPDAFLHYEDLDLCLRAAERGAPTILHPGVVVAHTGGHSTGRSPTRLEDEARRRRAVVLERLGPRAAALDDAAQALTFATRGARPGSPGARARAQLRALRAARGAGI